MLCPFQRTRDTRCSSAWLTPLHHQSLHPSNWFIWLWDGPQDPHTRAGILFIRVSPLAGERVQCCAWCYCVSVYVSVYIMPSVTYRCTSVSLSLTCSFFQLYSCSLYILILLMQSDGQPFKCRAMCRVYWALNLASKGQSVLWLPIAFGQKRRVSLIPTKNCCSWWYEQT